ncbi:MAG: hypothetical protein RRY21_03905, partial [Oscillospiraceae bacterium]
RSCGFVFDSRLWLLSDGVYLVVSLSAGTATVRRVNELASVPTTRISRDPTGGGTPLEPVNLLTPQRSNSFLGTATDTVYQLDAAGLDAAPLTVRVGQTLLSEGVDYSVDRLTGTLTFVKAPGVPAVLGADNVFVTFSRTVAGYAERITRCTAQAAYGLGANDHLFVGGNPDRPNLDWHSALEDPSYFPDTGYAVIGGGQSAVMGYLRIGEQLAIVKESSPDDSAVFLRSAALDDKNKLQFPVRAGISGVGAVSRHAILNLRDDPLFLSPTGMFAIASRAIAQEKTVQNRSRRIDARLTAEPELREAVAAQWGNYCVLALNGRCYVADARKQSPSPGGGDYEYEWYHWDNIPARVLRAVGERLWFGTADGRLCAFRTGSGIGRYSDDGAAITASWSTKADDDGDFMRIKQLARRGSGVLIKPYTRSSVRVLISTERDFGIEARSAKMDIFDLSELDFSRLSFSTSDTPQVVPFGLGARRYRLIRITVVNDAPGEGFGVFGIVRRYTVGGYVKQEESK